MINNYEVMRPDAVKKMKIKYWYVLLAITPFFLAATHSFAADCQALKKAIAAEKNLKKRRVLVADSIVQCPEDPVLNYKYGLSLERFRKYNKALSYYQKAALYDPKMGKAFAGMGDVYVYQGQLDKAIEVYQKAVKLMPGDNRAKNRLDLLEAKGKALEGEVLTVDEVVAVMDSRGKISTNTPLLLTGPVLQYNVAFVKNSNELQPKGIMQIAGIGQAMQSDALKHIRFEIATHLASPVSSLAALENSKIRAQMIVDQLVINFQINPKRINIVWYGDTMPLELSGVASRYVLNDRVEIKRIIE